jgi:hypothetical protein
VEKFPFFAYLCTIEPIFSNVWMMVIVPRIAVAPVSGAAPVVRDVCKSDFGTHFVRMRAHIDFLYGNQKDKASEKYWDAGLKAALRANPG